jgi:hypothetical protein
MLVHILDPSAFRYSVFNGRNLVVTEDKMQVLRVIRHVVYSNVVFRTFLRTVTNYHFVILRC